MEIKKTDSKGRIVLGDEGIYSVHRHDDGSISLQPIPEVPHPPTMAGDTMRAVYVDYAHPRSSQPPVVTIFSQLPEPAKFIARIAEECGVPIVVDGWGYGSGLAEVLRGVTTVPVVVRYPDRADRD